MSEIRLDRLYNQYVLIAPERLHRPDHLFVERADTRAADCPFCEGHEAMTPPEIFAIRSGVPDGPQWRTRVVPNLYKAVQIEQEGSSRREGMFEMIDGVGAHEVVIDSPCHTCRMGEMRDVQFREWLQTIAARVGDLRGDGRLVYVSVFKNHGQHAGATQSHPHTQIIALPVMPRDELLVLTKKMQYYRNHGRSKMEDILDNELLGGSRIIETSGNFIAFCPFAGSFPFEVMIAPTVPMIHLDQLERDDFIYLARLLRRTFARLDAQLGDFHFNIALRFAPLNPNHENEALFGQLDKIFRFSIRIMPRIYRMGGFELGTGMMINPVAPEEAANLLREVRI